MKPLSTNHSVIGKKMVCGAFLKFAAMVALVLWIGGVVPAQEGPGEGGRQRPRGQRQQGQRQQGQRQQRPRGAAQAGATEDGPQWWERGQDGWYYKDDWKGNFMQGGPLEKVISIDKPIRQAFLYVGGGSYTLSVNGQKIGSDIDAGIIEDYDITEILHQGDNTIVVDGRSNACEGAVVLADGSEILFASDESWGGRLAGERRSDRNSYGGDTHMARVLAITTEQKAKGMVNTVHMARRRTENYDCYMFWKNRDPMEVLTLDVRTPERQDWARIWDLLDKAKAGVEKPTALIKEGKFEEAIEAAGPAVEMVTQAEGILVNSNKRLDESNRVRAESLGRLEAAGNNVELNGSKYNRLGWVASPEPLDNDPLYWEFDIAPVDGGSIGLAGYWHFNLDIAAKGEETGWAGADYGDSKWNWIYAPSKWGWERQGYVKPNGRDGGGDNQVYNGHAWYRKSTVVPESWKGQDLVFNRTTRRDWYGQLNSNSYEVFVNGERMGPENSASMVDGNVTIPADKVKYGQENVIAIHVVNGSNYGGLMNAGLRLSVADRIPANRRSVCGPASVRQQIFRTPEGEVEQIVYSSSLSPGVVVATAGKSIRLGGWTAKGFANPTKATCVRDGKVVTLSLADTSSVEPGSLGENWLLLWSDADSPNLGRPTLVVFEKRPASIELGDDSFGGKGLTIGFEKAGGRIGIVRPFDKALKAEPDGAQVDLCKLWSRAMLLYPTGYLEELHFDGDICNVKMEYEYLLLRDDWGTEPVKLAPLPMLFSYALEYEWPHARYSGVAMDLGNRSVGGFYPQADTGTYKAIKNTSTLEYSFNRCEPEVVYKGIGIWSEWEMRDRLFGNVKKWGFNSTRPQLPLPAANEWDNPRQTERLQTMIDQSVKYGLMCFVNWFTGQDVPLDQRQNAIDRWKVIAEHYKDLPECVVIYDFMNEPANFRWDDYDNFMKQITEAVREVDKKHWISVEAGNGWAQPEDFDMTTHTGDEKTIYQYHFYGPHLGDCHRYDLWFPRYNLDEDRFRSYEAIEEQILTPLRFSIRNNQTQLFHGEFGTSFLGPDEATRLWLTAVLDLHEKYRAHWNWWNYDGGNINRTGLMSGDRENPLLSVLREYAAKGTPR